MPSTRLFYLPIEMVKELKQIQRENGLKSKAEAFRKIAYYCRIGRMVNKKNTNKFIGMEFRI